MAEGDEDTVGGPGHPDLPELLGPALLDGERLHQDPSVGDGPDEVRRVGHPHHPLPPVADGEGGAVGTGLLDDGGVDTAVDDRTGLEMEGPTSTHPRTRLPETSSMCIPMEMEKPEGIPRPGPSGP